MLQSMMLRTSNLRKPTDKPYINALVCTRKSVLILILKKFFRVFTSDVVTVSDLFASVRLPYFESEVYMCVKLMYSCHCYL